MFGLDRPKVAARARRWSWWAHGAFKGMLGLAVAWLLVGFPLTAATDRYRIAFDVADPKCLPETVYLVDMENRRVNRGDYVAFISRQMEPHIPNGTLIVKILAGVPGDLAVVNEQGATVAGVDWGPLHYLEPGKDLAEAGETLEDYRRTELILPDTYWMMAPLSGSYDSRYWGAIDKDQIVGKVYPIF